MTDTEAQSSKRPRSELKVALLLIVVMVSVIAYVDYAAFRAEGAQFLAVVHDLDGQSGSIGGWPSGKEHCIVFRRPLSDDEIARLAEVMSECRRRHFAIIFKDCEISDARLDQIRQRLFADSRGWVNQEKSDHSQ